MTKTIEPGSTYTFRIAPGRIGVARVFGEADRGQLYVMIARWNGPADTPFAKIQRAKSFHEPQPHTHHNWRNGILAGLAKTDIPRSVKLVGVSAVTKEERALFARMATSGAGWTWLLDQAKRQWRWDNEREKVLAADQREEKKKARDYENAVQAAAKKRSVLAKKGPKALLGRVWFSDFEPLPMRRAARELIAKLLERLPPSKRDQKRDVKLLAETVVAFNKLDGRFGRSFDTIDRENVMEALGEIASACGVPDAVFDRAVDAKRDF